MKPLILFDCSKEKKIKRLSQIDLFSASGNVVREIAFFFFLPDMLTLIYSLFHCPACRPLCQNQSQFPVPIPQTQRQRYKQEK